MNSTFLSLQKKVKSPPERLEQVVFDKSCMSFPIRYSLKPTRLESLEQNYKTTRNKTSKDLFMFHRVR